MTMKKELTPLMKQYWDVKSLHPDKILFFRMGDFFELFYDDAMTAAPLLGITLTQRNKKSEDSTPMCGMPHHSVAGPINKLLALGYKIAICDQIEDPKLAKGIVKRAVTRILTPGMVYDSDQLNKTEAHYICSLDQKRMSFLDTTTGECFYYEDLTLQEQKHIFSVLPIAELLISEDLKNLSQFFSHPTTTFIKPDGANEATNDMLVRYVNSLSDGKIKTILRSFEKRTLKNRLGLNPNTLRHLEIFQTYKGEEKGSLFHAVNRTQTAAGARLLRYWMRFPLQDSVQIGERQSHINAFRNELYELKIVREMLPKMGDIERRLSKISLPQCHGRDLTSLAESILLGLSVIETSDRLFGYSKKIDRSFCDAIANRILNTIVEEAPLSTKQGGLIKLGVSSELDEIIHLATHAHEKISELEQKERSLTGISSLKIRYNNVFGYYIEVTHTHKDKIPERYQRKQTLANAERYCTDELLEIERKVLSAQTRRNELEFAIFDELRESVLKAASQLMILARTVSEIDVYAGLAWLSLEESLVQPAFSQGQDLWLTDSRHLVVEQFQREKDHLSKFVSNSIQLKNGECLLITGPNMAGKSTLMRQVAITAILAQMGSFVPASKALLPIYDSVFTRIGASDQLTEGLSTFMVEMSETSEMLAHATEKSLLILDEVGRGTATFDGMCLAQSILEYVLSRIKAHVFFATHYHELVLMESKFRQIKNVHMKILDHKGQIEFLYILSAGPAGKSYGIQVAELAGLPTEIIERAQGLLSQLETKPKPGGQLSLF